MARKIRDYRNSGFVYASPVSTFLLLLLLTVAAFTLLNLAFYKLAPHSFSAAATPTLFTFFYYSFTHLGFSTIADLAPASPFTQTVAMAQSLLALLLGTVFVTMLFSVRNQKRMEELDDTIRCLEAESAEMEGYIRMEYKFNSVEEAMAELERLKTFLAKFLLKVTDNTV
jgi:signal transduction histidine kinase